ncbi:MAG TPA: 3'-5' exonuclease [Nevskiaceae bacterium]
MNFRIASTFTASLARLAGDEQKAVKTTAFDLQMDPSGSGKSFHKLDKARDKNFWSVRASRDLRLIVHRTPEGLLLCYVGHHDDAYRWAECRRIAVHPRTGAAQIVEIRERVEEVRYPKAAEASAPYRTTTALFARVTDDELRGWGVPEEWLPAVRSVVSEDDLLALTDHLPAEAAEALLDLATGVQPQRPAPAQPDPFEHPDAQRRFRSISTPEELRRALDFPWDRWTIFLHPAQREWVQKNFNGPARVSGSAGTGKTIVALHRAVHLARTHPDGRVLLTTFSDPLANALRVKLRRLIVGEPQLAERIDVFALDRAAERLYEASPGKRRIASEEEIAQLLETCIQKQPNLGFSAAFVHSEWRNVADAWQIESWEAYRDVRRLGRRTRLPEARRKALWTVFAALNARLLQSNRITPAGVYGRLAEEMPTRRHPPYDFVVVDEAQDIGVAQLRFLAALGGARRDALFFAGDLGQRIFQQPFSWKSLGVDIRGRARTLRVNYRTSHQIRTQADRLLEPVVTDVDGNAEQRAGTVSVFNGPAPAIHRFASSAEESAAVGAWLKACGAQGIAPHEMAAFVRSDAELPRALATVQGAALVAQVLDANADVAPGNVVVGTMHLAKGLEFRAVAVIACDEGIVPWEQRISAAADESDLEEIYDTERQLLYVACTRARDRLWVSGVAPGSEFLEDLGQATDG